MSAVVLVALAIVVIVGLVWVFQRSLIYFPSQQVPAPPVGVESVNYETDDGLTLSGWLLPAGQPSWSVIVFNGNAGNRTHRLPLGNALVDLGISVLLTDYRGYGGNPGSPSEEGLEADARAGAGFLRGRFPATPIVYFGESLGAGVAIGLANHEPPSALILRSPFTSLVDIGQHHYRYLPVSLLLFDRYPNLDRVPDVEAPVMVIAGNKDTIIPAEQSIEVYEAAPEPKQLVIIEGAGHNDIALLDGKEMIQAIRAFLEDHSPGS